MFCYKTDILNSIAGDVNRWRYLFVQDLGVLSLNLRIRRNKRVDFKLCLWNRAISFCDYTHRSRGSENWGTYAGLTLLLTPRNNRSIPTHM